MPKTRNATIAQNIQTFVYTSDSYLGVTAYEFKFDFFCPFCAEMHKGHEIRKQLPGYVGYLLECSAPDTINIYFKE